jgi:hypothetical protein
VRVKTMPASGERFTPFITDSEMERILTQFAQRARPPVVGLKYMRAGLARHGGRVELSGLSGFGFPSEPVKCLRVASGAKEIEMVN